jgi:predicted nicotinamide N-methyase
MTWLITDQRAQSRLRNHVKQAILLAEPLLGRNRQSEVVLLSIPIRCDLIPEPSQLRYRYQTIEFEGSDIHVRTLRDTQQFSDPNGVAQKLGVPEAIWPLFGVIWESSQVLARLMETFDIEGKRILEVGCGVGLTSLMLNSRVADITATDHHPEAESYLQLNVDLNEGRAIPFVRSGWEQKNTSLGEYDLIVGSDVLYQPDHAILLSGFVNRHAREKCEVIIVDPGRGNAAKFSNAMLASGFLQSKLDVAPSAQDGPSFKGRIRRFNR